MHHHSPVARNLCRGMLLLCSAWNSILASPLSYMPASLLSTKVCFAGALGTVWRGFQDQGTE